VVTAPAVDTADTDWPAETAGDLHTDWPVQNMDTDWPVATVSTAGTVDAGWSVPNDEAVDAVDGLASAFAARPGLRRRV